MKQIIESITQEEWQQFQNVNNQGDRASCQDDYAQFHIMRSSQFSVWPDELLSSYYDDLVRARDEGQNLVFNKYAYMMEKTDPIGYEKLKHVLPVISEERRKYLEPTVQIHVKWAEEFAEKYPHYASKGRFIHGSDEVCGMTSIETYQRGELYSYGMNTQNLYCDFVLECEKNDVNLTYLVREQMAKMYDYKSVEEMERS